MSMRLPLSVRILAPLTLASLASSLAADPTTKPASRPAAEKAMPASKPAAQSHPSAEAAKPLAKGAALPTVPTLKTATGAAFDLAKATAGKRTVVIFYRGGWCPYCMTHLAELAKLQDTFAANDVQVLAVSPDSVETLAAYGDDKQFPYTLLSDADSSAAKAFGIAFDVDAPTQGKLKEYGIDLRKASGTDQAVLPVPSVFVVNGEGTITFSHSNPDYRKRLSGTEVLAALGLKAESK